MQEIANIRKVVVHKQCQRCLGYLCFLHEQKVFHCFDCLSVYYPCDDKIVGELLDIIQCLWDAIVLNKGAITHETAVKLMYVQNKVSNLKYKA